MSDFMAHFAALMPDTLLAQPGATDLTGDFVASGEALSIPCRMEGGSRLVRDAMGQEVVSSVQCLLDGAYNLTVHGHRYTLPARFSPRENLQAIDVVKESDESGPLYEEVLLP